MMNSETKIAKIIELMNRDDSTDAPTQALKWAKNLYHTRAVETKQTVIQRIVAALQIDLLPGRAVSGERSGSAGKARQMLFKAAENGVDLRISKEAKGSTVAGQVLGSELTRLTVKLFGEANTFETETGEADDFQIKNIPAGVYQLSITGGDFEIVIEEIEL